MGIGTALADDPQLTARIEGVHRQPRRVVFDSEGRLPLDSKLVTAADEIPLTVVVSRAAPRLATDALEAAGIDVIVASGQNEPRALRSALDQLGARDVTSILLEGGPHLAGAFLDAGEIDEIRLFLAPLVLGGRTARDPLEGQGAESIADAVRALTLDCETIGERPPDHGPAAGVVSVFTGLVADLGTVTSLEDSGEGVRLGIGTALARELRVGDSVAVNGVCLTATSVDGDAFGADVMHETLRAPRWAPCARAIPSTSSFPCAPPTASAGTSCRATWTASGR